MLKSILSLFGIGKGQTIGSLAKDIREAVKGKEIDPKEALELIKIQNEVNKLEAQHRSVFVSGWRPFIGWICGIALAYNFIIRDIVSWFAPNALPPALQMEHLMTVLLGMLGLGGLRTYEKLKDKTK